MNVKYGVVGGPEIIREYPVAAAEVFEHLSGCFVTMNSSGYLEVASATDTAIFGWAKTGDFTSSTTAGRTKVPVNICRETLYRMPIDVAQTEAALIAMLGESCDIVLSSNTMYADLDATGIDILEVVDYERFGALAGQQAVIVRLNLVVLTVARDVTA